MCVKCYELRGSNSLKTYAVIVKIRLTTSRIFTYFSLFLERYPRNKRRTTVHYIKVNFLKYVAFLHFHPSLIATIPTAVCIFD